MSREVALNFGMTLVVSLKDGETAEAKLKSIKKEITERLLTTSGILEADFSKEDENA